VANPAALDSVRLSGRTESLADVPSPPRSNEKCGALSLVRLGQAIQARQSTSVGNDA
jgi:hypothetical protein